MGSAVVPEGNRGTTQGLTQLVCPEWRSAAAPTDSKIGSEPRTPPAHDSLVDVTEAGETATASANATAEISGRTQHFRVVLHLVKERGRWYVCGLNAFPTDSS